MRTATLQRVVTTSHGTVGHLYIANMLPLFTMEEEDQDNQRNISSIPAGIYTCKRDQFRRRNYETFKIINVPNRSDILIHRGNTEEDTMGCLLLGSRLGFLEVTDEDTGIRGLKLAVLDSGIAFGIFMRAFEGVDAFELKILDPVI